MPYIKKERRAALRSHQDLPQDPGELNFVITMICDQYRRIHPENYATVNDIIGALEGAKLEFYRRVAAPYEDKKIEENGDVY